MPDRNLFDDDSLIPEWMRNADLGGSEEDSSFDPDATMLPEPPSGPSAPWERMPGAPPPRPSRLTPAAPPWEQFAGEEAPPPQMPTAAAPWEAPGEPEEEAYPPAPELPAWGASISTGSSVEIDHDFEWSTTEPGAGPSSPRSGLTSMLGDLPWMEQKLNPPLPPTPGPSASERAGLDERPITMSDLASEFDQEPPAAPPPPPQKPPSLADRLRAASPKQKAPSPPPAPATPEETEWMSGFGQASGPQPAAPAGDESDLDWLMPPAAEPETPADSGAQFDQLFDDEFPEDQSAGPGFEEQDLPWLADQDQEAQPASPEPAPDWLRAGTEEPAAPRPDTAPPAEEPPAPPPKIRKLGQPTPPPVESAPPAPEAAQPPKIRKLGQPTPPPAQAGPPPKIRKLGQPAEPAPPEPAPQPMTYEEWEQLQIEQEIEASKTPEDRLLEEVPDWFKAMDQQPPAPPSATPPAAPAAPQEPEFMPGWFMGLEESAPEEAPDWLQKMDYSSDLMTQPFASAEPVEPPPPDEAEIPDWFKGAAAPEIEGVDWNALFGSAEQPPEPPAPPPAPAEEPLPDWMSQAPAEEELPLPDLLGDLEEPEAAPGEMPDWLGAAAPAEEELPLPDLLGDLEEPEAAPGEMPDWLSAAAPAGREIAAPEEIPFPELDLDQIMPGEAALGDEGSQTYEEVLDEEFPLPPAESPAAGDFVERFDPLEPDLSPTTPERPSVTRRSLDDEAPDWLRELASEEELPTDRLEELPTSAPPWEAESLPEENLDWLGEISAEDVAPADYAALVTPEERPVTDMPPRPAPGSMPETGLLETEPVDSAALDRLLGGYDLEAPVSPPAQEPLPDLEALWEEPAPGEIELWGTDQEAAGVSESPLPPTGSAADLETMLFEAGSGEAVPDLEALFDESGFEEPFAAEMPPEPEPEPEQRRRAVPEAPPLFKPQGEPEAPAEAAPELPQAPQAPQPEWISEMRPSDLPVVVRAGGAETSVKQKQVVELPERLRAFREATLRELQPPEEAPAPAQQGPLAGITGALPAADVMLPKAAARPIEGLVITKEQQARLNRLQALLDQLAAEEDLAEQDKAGFEEAAWMAMGGEAPAEAPAPEAAPRRARRQRRLKLDRVLVAVLLLVALIVPFATDALHFGDDPAALTGDRQAAAVNVDTVGAGSYVLFAFEYGPTAAGELDPLAEAVLRDVLARQATPLILSTNAAGIFHAEAVITPLAGDARLLAVRGQGETALQASQDYFILSYLPGEAVGVRSLRNTSEDAQGNLQVLPAFKHDLRGDGTGLDVTSLDRDIALIVVAGEDSNAVRMWAEQLDGVKVPKIALVTAAIEPLAVPYVNRDGYAGYLAGVRDAYRYNAARNTGSSDPYKLPEDLPVDLPNPEEARWHSMALGAAAAAGLIAFGMVINLLRGLIRRRRR